MKRSITRVFISILASAFTVTSTAFAQEMRLDPVAIGWMEVRHG